MEISINQKQQNELTAVYTQLNDEQKAVLNDIFGEDTFKPKDIRDRVKTFEDACTVLGIDPDEWKNRHLMFDKDVLAYLKLRVIAKALNEGWYPKFTEDERRYYPWFYIITKEEYDNLSAEEKRRCVGRAYSNASAGGGLVYAHAGQRLVALECVQRCASCLLKLRLGGLCWQTVHRHLGGFRLRKPRRKF